MRYETVVADEAAMAGIRRLREQWEARMNDIDEPVARPSHAADPMVQAPPHYTAGPVECIDAIEAALGREGALAFCRGSAIKYLWRAGLKGPAAQDLGKARWYVERALALAANAGEAGR